MSLFDRLLRSLFVACLVGLLWGIRGDFGHSLGAMAPGAALGLGFACVAGQRSMFRWQPLLGAAGALFISLGGIMSYGILHGYAKANTLVNYAYGFLTLLLEGGAWGALGGAAIGLLLERKEVKFGQWISCAITAYVGGALTYAVVVTLAGFHINPPRNDLSIGFFGATFAVMAWMVWQRRMMGLRGTLLGFWGFGIGMALGRCLGNATYHLPQQINSWNVMEISCGFIGGFVFTFGMLGHEYAQEPDDADWPLVNPLAMLYVMAGIVGLHRLRRIDSDKLTGWQETFRGMGFEQPEEMATTVLNGLGLICLLALIAALTWCVLHRRRMARWAAFAPLTFALLMVLFQSLHALDPWREPQENYIHTHHFSWILWGIAAVLALFFELRGAERTATPTAQAGRVPWLRWLITGAATYAAILFASAFINGEETMTSANTRFPIWSWTDPPAESQ